MLSVLVFGGDFGAFQVGSVLVYVWSIGQCLKFRDWRVVGVQVHIWRL